MAMMELPLGDAPGVGRPVGAQPPEAAPAPAESARIPVEPAHSAPSTGAPFVAPPPAAAPPPGQAARPASPAGPGAPQGPAPAAPAAPAPRPIAPKEYYSISEVCDLVGLKPHVLRYWESQFPVLNPSKNRSGNRVYQRKEIKLVMLVQHLLYNEKYTIEGARQRLEQLRRGGELPHATSSALDAEARKLLREELQQLLHLLERPRG